MSGQPPEDIEVGSFNICGTKALGPDHALIAPHEHGQGMTLSWLSSPEITVIPPSEPPTQLTPLVVHSPP